MLNKQEITNPVPIKPKVGGYQEDTKSPAPFLDFIPQSMSPLIGFNQDPFQPNYVNLSSQYGMFYQPYQAQYQAPVTKCFEYWDVNILVIWVYVITLQKQQLFWEEE